MGRNAVNTVSEAAHKRRWYRLNWHPIQEELWNSTKRFNIVPAGRRSGKTELGKRKGVVNACTPDPEGKFSFVAFTAPTYEQAKKIFWKDIKLLVPPWLVKTKSENEMIIELRTNKTIMVTGTDKPERLEGIPISWIQLDEYANMKETVWTNHIRPTLSDINCLGDCWFTGVPEGRNHYYTLWEAAAHKPKNWGRFTWFSSSVLPAEEIEDAKDTMDPATFRQEYEASFENFAGAVYYTFNEDNKVDTKDMHYEPAAKLVFCFDFNVKPGSVVILQEDTANNCTLVIDEIFIKDRYTNAEELCRMCAERYSARQIGGVILAGDPTGGNKHISQGVQGTAWDQIKAWFKFYFGKTNDVVVSVGYEEIRESTRIRAMNSRIRTMSGRIGLRVSRKCQWLIKDLEGVGFKENSTEIDKTTNPDMTHLSEALGFYIARKFPVKFDALVPTGPARMSL